MYVAESPGWHPLVTADHLRVGWVVGESCVSVGAGGSGRRVLYDCNSRPFANGPCDNVPAPTCPDTAPKRPGPSPASSLIAAHFPQFPPPPPNLHFQVTNSQSVCLHSACSLLASFAAHMMHITTAATLHRLIRPTQSSTIALTHGCNLGPAPFPTRRCLCTLN
jgi:hypothetical protein